MQPSPPKRAHGLASPWSPSTPSTPSSPSTWRSPAPSVLLPGEAVAESFSRDGSHSARSVQFPGAVILRYSDIRSGQLQLRGGARAKGPAEPEGRFDDADPDPTDSCAAQHKTPPRDIVRRSLTAPSEVPSFSALGPVHVPASTRFLLSTGPRIPGASRRRQGAMVSVWPVPLVRFRFRPSSLQDLLSDDS